MSSRYNMNGTTYIDDIRGVARRYLENTFKTHKLVGADNSDVLMHECVINILGVRLELWMKMQDANTFKDTFNVIYAIDSMVHEFAGIRLLNALPNLVCKRRTLSIDEFKRSCDEWINEVINLISSQYDICSKETGSAM